MAIPHAQPGEVIEIRPFGAAFEGAKTSALIKGEGLEVIRLVVPRGKEIATHKTRGEITVHCLEGRVSFTVEGVARELGAGQMLYLRREQPHSVLGLEDASLLVTISITRDPATDAKPADS
jgi:quercetin dioxygenase-like cupin family protein